MSEPKRIDYPLSLQFYQDTEYVDHDEFEKRIFSGHEEEAIGLILKVLGALCDGQHRGLQVSICSER